jgi:hypothetical protein
MPGAARARLERGPMCSISMARCKISDATLPCATVAAAGWYLCPQHGVCTTRSKHLTGPLPVLSLDEDPPDSS